MIRTVIPKSLLSFLFPHRFESFNCFIKINDMISSKDIYLYLREDSFMEKVIKEKGLYGEWEKESLKIWAALSPNANVILDIGANTGIFSMISQAGNPNAKIIAVEPVDINHEVLQKNITKNRFSIRAEKVAISDTEGTAKMFMLKDRLNYMTSVNDDRYADAPHVKGNYPVVEIEVPIKPFSWLANKHRLDNIDLIKLDVEGHELTVLNGMLPWLQKYKPTILIEVIGDENAVELNKMFTSLGYSYISIDEENVSRQVEKVWDNQHHNFLITDKKTIDFLRQKKLVI